MPAFALLMLLIWPVVTAVIFSRMDHQRALVWTMLSGYLILPPLIEIDLPLFPGINKAMIPALCAGLMLFLSRDQRRDDPHPPPMGLVVSLLLVMNFTSPMLTTITNPDTLYDGINVRPNMSITQGMGDTMVLFMQLLPFLMGYNVLWNQRGAELLLKALVTGILCYSALMLFELRFSPQTNIIVYGYFQHDFIQTIRYGGYRPIVFLEHPLWVALITMWAFLAAIALARGNPTGRNILIACYLGCIVLLCKSAGALIQALIAAPLVALARPRLMVLVAALVATVAFTYPTLRATPFSPMQGILDTAMAISPDRGRSLEFRLTNEEQLLERALERPLFGWGGWGRPLFYDPYDGRLSSVPDGQWVIWIGAKGIYGYLAIFLLLLVPIFTMLRAMPKGGGGPVRQEYLSLGCLSLMLAMNCLDLIPNATQTPITWLAAGALLGNARRLLVGVEATGTSAAVPQYLPKKAGIQTVL
ncbi:hypothetical protein [Paracoccus yeei]|uniref:Uncharacterized protein n=1 Tax=Paracoccus yeei TaxID=147645 RepID=A0A5P2R042_9RHOB|nr:hypothetical protein [Paracoccus yeei]MBY0135683.1 hypothetical protein [Paracoccus yeei]QEU10132.1 hypothetical protein FOB51_20180 [Paracoccus yeei]